jgi:hypothetical protein
VEQCETRIAGLRAALENESLYATSEGAREATRINAELTLSIQELDAAMQAWTDATENLEGRMTETKGA